MSVKKISKELLKLDKKHKNVNLFESMTRFDDVHCTEDYYYAEEVGDCGLTQPCPNNFDEDRDHRVTQSHVFKIAVADGNIKYDRSKETFYFTENDGRYFRKIPEAIVEDEIAALLPASVRSRLSNPLMNNIIGALKREPSIRIAIDEDRLSNLINMKNGVLDIRDLKIAPPDFSYGFTSCLMARYFDDASIEDAPTFFRFVNTSLNGDPEKIRLLLQTQAFLFSNMPAKKAVFYVGEPNSGKSVILRFLEKIYGKENVSNIPFHKLGERFYLDRLQNAQINISSELKNVRSGHLDAFKALTGGGDSLMAEKKGQTPYFFTARTKLVFAGNVMPKVNEIDLTGAFLNRLVVLRFPNSIPAEKQDQELIEKLSNERDAIFSLAMKELPTLCKNGFVFSDSKADCEALHQYENNQNNIYEFVQDRCSLDGMSRTWTSSLYREYCQYCTENNLEPHAKTAFNEALDSHPKLSRQKFRLNKMDGPKHGYTGIKLKSIHDDWNTGTVEQH